MLARPDIFALDATARPRPGGIGLASLVADIRCHYPDLLLLADIACVAEDVEAEKPGFDFVGTGLHGYIHEKRAKNGRVIISRFCVRGWQRLSCR